MFTICSTEIWMSSCVKILEESQESLLAQEEFVRTKSTIFICRAKKVLFLCVCVQWLQCSVWANPNAPLPGKLHCGMYCLEGAVWKFPWKEAKCWGWPLSEIFFSEKWSFLRSENLLCFAHNSGEGFRLEYDEIGVVQSNSAVGKVLSLHLIDSALIPGILYTPPPKSARNNSLVLSQR